MAQTYRVEGLHHGAHRGELKQSRSVGDEQPDRELHRRDSLNEAERDEWNNWRSRRIGFAADGGLSLEDYRVLLEALKRERRDPRDIRVLADLQVWGERLAESL